MVHFVTKYFDYSFFSFFKNIRKCEMIFDNYSYEIILIGRKCRIEVRKMIYVIVFFFSLYFSENSLKIETTNKSRKEITFRY